MPGLARDAVASNLVETIANAAAAEPQRRALTFLEEGERVRGVWTIADLDRKARAIAATLRELGAPGERALIIHPNSLEYIASFCGCLYAGMVPVPVYQPTTSRFRRTALGVRAIARDCEAAFAFAPSPLGDWAAATALGELPGFRGWLHPERFDDGAADRFQPLAPAPDAVAFLQYTSGSTGQPKGVMVSHGNLLHNARAFGAGVGCSSRSTTISWLPLYHDLGLIGCVIAPLAWGAEVVLMTPDDFVVRPARWLEAITRFEGRYTAAPNFAFELCLRKVGEEQRQGLDLSSLEVAVNGAEPVRADTLERFTAAYRPHGFHREAFRPVWGLAEATLIITADEYRGGVSTVMVDEAELAAGRVRPAGPAAERRGKTLVSCGPAVSGHDVAIVDPGSGRPCQPDEVGEIWVSGPSLAAGYWLHPDETTRTYDNRLEPGGGRWLRTGDLGFLAGGRLYIAGRLKDVIITRGQNHYPQDIEYVVEQVHRALRPGCGAAFALELDDTEFAVMVQEIDPARAWNAHTLLRDIRQTVAAECDLLLDGVVLIEPRTVPKTSSGKIQRSASRDALLAGQLPVLAQWRSPALALALTRAAVAVAAP